MKHYDLIAIGTGGANIVVDAAIKKGLRCAQIEKGKFGGTCLTRGCIPTKVLVTAADAIQEIKELPKIGVNVSPATMDWEKVSERVWEKIDESKGVKEYYESKELVDVYAGVATFTGEKEITVFYSDGTHSEPMTATNIVIGTGAHTNVPPLKGLNEVGFLSSESFFGNKYPKKPYRSITILGGGAIATEFAHIFNSAGTKVTLIQRSDLLVKKEEEIISKTLARLLEKAGITIHTNVNMIEVREEHGEKIIRIEHKDTGKIEDISSEEILVATGISPAIEELHLENTKIEQFRGNWIKTNEFLETSVEGIYAIGDVNGQPALRHKANYEADILAHNLYVATSPDEYRWARYDLVPMVTYTYPQIAHVGLTEKEAREKGYNVGTGINYYANTAKGFAMGYDEENQKDAFVKIVVDKDTNSILGIHVIGPQASILFQPYINLMNAGVQRLIPIHEDIASPLVKSLREKGLTRNLDPHSVISVGETMTAHPSLSEVIMWTQVYYENRW